MVRLIFNSLFLVVIAIFIGLNVSHNTDINLFGRMFQDVPVIVVIILSIVVGVLYSLLFYALNQLLSIDKDRWRERHMLTKQREKELEQREKSVDRLLEERLRAAQMQVDHAPRALPESEPRVVTAKDRQRTFSFKRPKREAPR